MTSWRSRWQGLSFRARLGSAIAVAVGLTVALASLAAYFTVRHQLLSQVDTALVNDMKSAQPISPGPRGGSRVELGAVSNIVLQNGGFVQVIDANRNVLISNLPDATGTTGFRPTPAEGAMVGQGLGYRIDTINFHHNKYRIITEGGLVSSSLTPGLNGIPVALQIARPLGEVNRTLSTLGLILWLVAAAGIAAAVGIGFVLGRAMLRPVAKLTAAAEHVAATQDLNARIDAEGDDELARLARSFNAMLNALAASREQQAQLISDAGHELRTPLTSLRTNIEVLMRVRDLPAADRAELVGDVEAQMEELTTLIGDLVDLARQEETQPEPIEIRLDSLVERAVERAHRRAPGLAFDVHLTAGSVRAAPALLERAVLNVLDNAAKWSPPGGTVEVWLQRGGCWTLDIHDHGPGISPADLPRVFDRFYRAETARSMPGSGLGLAIVHQVVTDHGGTVDVSIPPDGGTLVHIELPIVVEMEADGADHPTAGGPAGWPAGGPAGWTAGGPAGWTAGGRAGGPAGGPALPAPPPPAPGPSGEVAWSGPPRHS